MRARARERSSSFSMRVDCGSVGIIKKQRMPNPVVIMPRVRETTCENVSGTNNYLLLGISYGERSAINLWNLSSTFTFRHDFTIPISGKERMPEASNPPTVEHKCDQPCQFFSNMSREQRNPHAPAKAGDTPKNIPIRRTNSERR